MKEFTQNQAKLLHFISQYRREHGAAPALKEIVSELGVSDNKSAVRIIEVLTKHGYLTREAGKSRTLSLTDKAVEEFLVGYLIPYRYHEIPTATDQLRLSDESARADVAVLSPTSELEYKGDSIKTNGTSLDNDIRTVVETAVSLAIDRYFNGTSQAEPNLKQGLAVSIVDIVRRVLADETSVEIFGWGIILTGLTWANITILENVLTALVYSVVEAIVIKKLLNE